MQVDSSQFRLLHSNTKLSEAYQLTSQNTIFFIFFIVHSRLNGFFTTKSVQYRAVFRGWDLRVQPPEIDKKNFWMCPSVRLFHISVQCMVVRCTSVYANLSQLIDKKTQSKQLLSGAWFYVLNTPKIVCRPGSARTRWGSLQRSPISPSWIMGKGGERGEGRAAGQERGRGERGGKRKRGGSEGKEAGRMGGEWMKILATALVQYQKLFWRFQ